MRQITLPDGVKRDVQAVRSMNDMINMNAGQCPKLAKDMANRMSQALGRIADWEDANPEIARQIAEMGEEQT